jgi:hypothetical protein
MSRDFDDIYKKIDQSHKDLYSNDKEMSKDQEKMRKDILEIKKEVKDIAFKVDTMLEILNSFTIMLAEDDEDLEENYDIDDSDETWVPEEDEFWKNDE